MAYGRRKWDFASGGVPAEFTQILAGDGALSVSDDELRMEVVTATAGNDAAGVAIPFDRTLARYQRIAVCTRMLTIAGSPRMAGPLIEYITSGVSTPPADATAWFARHLIGHYTNRPASSNFEQYRYYDTGAALQCWQESTQAWASGAQSSTLRAQQAADYVVRVIDWDDANDRVRLATFGGTTGSSLSADRNGHWYLAGLTDWVHLSSIRDGDKTSDLYITVGFLTSVAAWGSGTGQVLEWIEHEWADELQFMAYNCKAYNSGSGYDRRAMCGLRMDTHFWLPVSRTGTMVAPVASTWESGKSGQWAGITRSHVAGKYVMAYSGSDGTNPRIGIATATDPFSTWTKYGSNPVLGIDAGTDYEQKLQPIPVEDWTEPDPAKRCKLVVTVLGSDGFGRVYLYTASTWETTSWTREGELLSYDAANDGDVSTTAVVVLHDGRTWHIFYSAPSSAAAMKNYVAHGPRLAVGQFTKDRTIDFLPSSDGVEMAVSAGSSTSRTVTVDSTTGVVRDDWVCYDNDATTSNWRLGRVRKIVSSTQLELYSLMPGMTNSGVLRTIRKGKNSVRSIHPFGDEWLFHGTSFGPMFLHATYGAEYEGGSRWRGSWFLAKPAHDPLGTPGAYLSLESNTTGSTENPAILRRPVMPLTPTIKARQRRRLHHVLR